MLDKKSNRICASVLLALAALFFVGAGHLWAFSVDVKKIDYFDPSNPRSINNYDFSAGITPVANTVVIPDTFVTKSAAEATFTYTFGPYPDGKNDITVALDTVAQKAILTVTNGGGCIINTSPTLPDPLTTMTEWVFAVQLRNFTGMTDAAKDYRAQIGFHGQTNGPHVEFTASWKPAAVGRNLVLNAEVYDDNVNQALWAASAPVTLTNPDPQSISLTLRIRRLVPATSGNIVFDYSIDGGANWTTVGTLVPPSPLPANFPHVSFPGMFPYVSLNTDMPGTMDPFHAFSNHEQNGYFALVFVDDPGQALYQSVHVTGDGLPAGGTDLAFNGGQWWLPQGVNLSMNMPAIFPSYHIVAKRKDLGPDDIRDRSITGYVTDFAGITSPPASVSAPPTFAWTWPAAAPAPTWFGIHVMDMTAFPSVQVMSQYNLAGSTTSVPYNGNVLVDGHSYQYTITAGINAGNEGNTSQVRSNFTYSVGGGSVISFSNGISAFTGYPNAPIQGALVSLADNPLVNVTTDVNGAFSLQNIPAGPPFSVKITAPGYVDVYSAQIPSDQGSIMVQRPYLMLTTTEANAPPWSVLWTNKATAGIILGAVLNTSVSPYAGVAGAVISAVNAVNTAISYPVSYTGGGTSTIADGAYTIANVPDGTTVMVSIVPNAATNAYSWVFTQAPVTVHAGALSEESFFGASVPVAVSTFTNEAAFNAAVLPTKLVDFEDRNTPSGRIAFTGNEYAADGITFLSPNSQPLWIYPPANYWNSKHLSPGNAPYEGGDNNEDSLNIQFNPPVTAIGWTFIDYGSTNGESIRAYAADNSLIYENTDLSVIAGAGVGQGNNPFWGISSPSKPIARVEIVEAANDGDDIAYDNFRFSPVNQVVGTVTIGGGVKDANNVAIDGATVELVGAAPANTVVTAGGGLYSITIPSGIPFFLKFSKPGDPLNYVPSYSAVMIFTGDNPAIGDLTLHAQSQYAGWNVAAGKGIVRARVKDQAGAFVGGVTVTAFSRVHSSFSYYTICYDDACTAGLTATEGTSGRYIVKDVEPGDTVTVSAQKDGWTFNQLVYQIYADSVHQVGIKGTQNSPPVCTYALVPVSPPPFGANGGTGSVTMTTAAGCMWTATSDSAWITVKSGANGNGNGTVTYSVAQNNTGADRSGALTVGGQTFPITQTGTVSFTAVLQDSNNNPIEGAAVAMVDSAALTATTGATGVFTLSGLPANQTFSLSFLKNNYVPTYTSNQQSAGNIVSSRPFKLYTATEVASWGVVQGKSVILGRVANRLNPTTGFIEGAMVTATGKTKSYPVTYRDDTGVFGGSQTYANGKYYVLNVDPDDTVIMTARKPGWSFQSPTFVTHADAVSLGGIQGTPLPIGMWGHALLGQSNDPSGFAWSAEANMITFLDDGVTATVNYSRNEKGMQTTGNGFFTYTFAANPDGTFTLWVNEVGGTSKPVRMAVSDDGNMAVIDGTADASQRRLEALVRIGGHFYTNTSLNGDYYGMGYEHNANYTAPPIGNGYAMAISDVTTFDGAGAYTYVGKANSDGTLWDDNESAHPRPYGVLPNGIVDIQNGSFRGYLSTNGKMALGSGSFNAGNPLSWVEYLFMKKGDRIYSTADLAGTWAFAGFGDAQGMNFRSEFGKFVCDAGGSCTFTFRTTRSDGTADVAAPLSVTFAVAADGSLGVAPGSTVPFGAIGNGGLTLILNRSFASTNVNDREVLVAIRSDQIGNLFPDTSADEAAIRAGLADFTAAYNALITAYNQANVDKFMAFYASDYLQGGEGKAMIRTHIEELFQKPVPPLSGVVSSVNINGDLAAIQIAWTNAPWLNGSGLETVYLKKINGLWLLYGNQIKYRVEAWSGAQKNNGQFSYWASLMVDDPSAALQSVTVNGPKTGNTTENFSLTWNLAEKRWVSWAGDGSGGPNFGNVKPALPLVYTVTLTETVNPTKPIVMTTTINNFVDVFSTPVSPVNGETVKGRPTFTWTNVGANFTYGLELNGPNGFHWGVYDLTATTYTYDGAPLAAGNYSYNVQVRDKAGNFSMATLSFVYSAEPPAVRGDMNGDMRVDLADVILVLQTLNGRQPAGIRPDLATAGVDVNGDGKIGLEDMPFTLQKTAGLRTTVSSGSNVTLISQGHPPIGFDFAAGRLTEGGGDFVISGGDSVQGAYGWPLPGVTLVDLNAITGIDAITQAPDPATVSYVAPQGMYFVPGHGYAFRLPDESYGVLYVKSVNVIYGAVSQTTTMVFDYKYQSDGTRSF